jgi:NADH-quinone oxidoreductase subunit N
LALALAIFMFSMAGIPPLAGFFGKLYIFLAALDGGLVWPAIIGVLSSVVAAYYYLRIIKVMYFDQPAEQLDHPVERPLGAVMAAGALVTVGLVVFLAPVLGVAQSAAASLFGG